MAFGCGENGGGTGLRSARWEGRHGIAGEPIVWLRSVLIEEGGALGCGCCEGGHGRRGEGVMASWARRSARQRVPGDTAPAIGALCRRRQCEGGWDDMWGWGVSERAKGYGLGRFWLWMGWAQKNPPSDFSIGKFLFPI